MTILGILFVGPIILLRADFLRINNIEISGTENISPENIKQATADYLEGNKYFFIPKSNIFLLSKNTLKAALLTKFGRLENIEINKQFFQKTVELTITERKAEYLWCSVGNACYYMSRDGLVFERASLMSDNTDGKVVFKGVLDGEPIMQRFASAVEMQKYSDVIKILQDSNLKVISLYLESMDKLSVNTNMGEIILNPGDTDISLSAQNALVLIQEIKSKNASASFLYIDARYGNKIYYKLR